MANDPRKFDPALVAVAVYHAQFKIGMLCFDFYRNLFTACVDAAKEITTEWSRPR